MELYDQRRAQLELLREWLHGLMERGYVEDDDWPMSTSLSAHLTHFIVELEPHPCPQCGTLVPNPEVAFCSQECVEQRRTDYAAENATPPRDVPETIDTSKGTTND